MRKICAVFLIFISFLTCSCTNNNLVQPSTSPTLDSIATPNGTVGSYATPIITASSTIKPTVTPTIEPTVKPTSPISNNAEVGDSLFWGEFEQDNVFSNGKEKIEWVILDKKDGKALVVSKCALDCRKYHHTYTDITWEKCEIRAWLNNEFFNSAFNDREKELIAMVEVSMDKNPYWDTEPGKPTEDKIFLLSVTEVRKYFPDAEQSRCDATQYAIDGGAEVFENDVIYGVNPDDYLYKNNCYWWLRTSGSNSKGAVMCNMDGNFNMGGINVARSYAIRPAMWIKIS